MFAICEYISLIIRFLVGLLRVCLLRSNLDMTKGYLLPYERLPFMMPMVTFRNTKGYHRFFSV